MMVALANSNLSLGAIRQQIAGAIELFVQVARLSDGSRKIVEIAECAGLVDGEVQVRSLFRYERVGIYEDGTVEGSFSPTDRLEPYLERLQRGRSPIPRSLIKAGTRTDG
jgi:pilus assembly protein CpaF